MWVDYKNSETARASAQSGHRNRANAVLGLPNRLKRAPARATPSMGAIRISAEPEPRFKHLRLASAGLLIVSGGILATSQSNGNVVENTTIVKTAPTALAAMTSPTLLSPTFFFDDRENALGDAQQLLDSSISAKNKTVAIMETGSETELLASLSADLQADDTQEIIDEMTLNELLVDSEDLPKTTTISPLANHPSIAALRQKAEFPEGGSEETVTVSSGDTLSKLLNDRGVKIEHMPQLLMDEVVKTYLADLKIGQSFNVVRHANGDFHSLSAKVGKDRRITIRRSDNDFAVASIDLPVEKERVVTSGTIDQSLYVAAEQANLKQSTIMELSDIFQWELDFARDIRKGDQFSLIYDRLYREGKYIGDGDILAAEFVRGGKHYQAVRYTDPEGNTGYYAPNGDSKRRTFLRHPVDVVRITSRFDPKRVHPVLHKIVSHRGVDYGSPTGTPIRATANGVVHFAGNRSSYGKTVILNHGTDIRTLYAHMSRISDKVATGKRVKQGDVIGYVGATGRVTGAHLHYEFQKNGKHVDPLKVKLPAAQPLRAELREELRILSDDLLAQMSSVIPTEDAQVADAKAVTE